MQLIADKEKKIKFIAGFIAVMLSLLILMMPSADAAGSIKSAPYAMASQITEGSAKNIKAFLTKNGKYGDLYKFATGENNTVSSSNGKTFNFNKQFKTLTYILAALGMSVAVLLAFYKMFVSLEKGQDALETTLRLLFEVTVVLLIIVNIGPIIQLITDIGDLIASSVTPDKPDKLDLGVQILQGMGIKPKQHGDTYYVGGLNWFKAVAILLVPWVLSFLVTIGGYFVVFTILFELMLRRLFTPFAIADIYGEGLRSPGMRYLKKYLAIFLKIAVVLATCYLIGICQTIVVPDTTKTKVLDDLKSVIGFILMVLAINFSGIGIMLKGGEIANDIAGA